MVIMARGEACARGNVLDPLAEFDAVTPTPHMPCQSAGLAAEHALPWSMGSGKPLVSS
jgi:hypothetical protein